MNVALTFTVVATIVADVAIIEVMDLFFFLSYQFALLAHLIGHRHLHCLLNKLHIFSPDVSCLIDFGFCHLSFIKLRCFS